MSTKGTIPCYPESQVLTVRSSWWTSASSSKTSAELCQSLSFCGTQSGVDSLVECQQGTCASTRKFACWSHIQLSSLVRLAVTSGQGQEMYTVVTLIVSLGAVQQPIQWDEQQTKHDNNKR